MTPITVDYDVAAWLASNSPVAIGVSGGKDSTAVAFATVASLDQMGHTGPRVLIHSDLGRVEWQDSLPTCQRLAETLGLELIVVRRGAGDLLDRWQTRWENNVARYANLECVKLILPWSTAGMRFCTSELKTAIICRELVRRFPGQTIISVSGIRRDESPNRAKAPISKPQPKLTSTTHRTTGLDWHPILDWTIDDVWASLDEHGFERHEAYRIYGSSRVSCVFCILGSRHDLAASSTCPENQETYRAMVDLEVASTFSFQDTQWLGDVAPHLLSIKTRAGLILAKAKARQREEAEAAIPQHLLYVKGWPTVMPTYSEAMDLCIVRRKVAGAVGLDVDYTTPAALIGRYQELMDKKAVAA